MLTIKTIKDLEKVCNEFLAAITERKQKAHEFKDIRSCYRTEKYYVTNSSREYHQGWFFGLDSRTDSYKFFECVVCGSDCVCNTYYWLNGFDRVKVNQRNEISIRIDDYEYISTKDDNPRKRDILLLLVSKLEELFKD